MGFFSGWGGRVAFGVSNPISLPVTRWQVTAQAEMVDITTAKSGNTREWLPGYLDIEATFDLLHDTNLDPFSDPNPAQDFASNDPHSLRPGDNVYLVLNCDKNLPTTQRWVLPFFLVSSVVFEDEVRGVAKYTVTGKQSGQFLGTSGKYAVEFPDASAFDNSIPDNFGYY